MPKKGTRTGLHSCPNAGCGGKLMKNGTNPNGTRRWQCQSCKRQGRTPFTWTDDDLLSSDALLTVTRADENTLTVAWSGASMPITEKELSKRLKLDMAVWHIESLEVKNYEVARSNKQADLEWEKGKMTGSVSDEGEMTVQNLWSVKALIKRRKPVAVQPVVQPVVLKMPSLRAPRIRTKRVQRSLIIPDIHVGFIRDPRTQVLLPFHDRKALALVTYIVKRGSWDAIYILGDLLDMTEFTDKFLVTPDAKGLMQPAIIEAAFWLAAIRLAAPGVPISYLEGNHELRLTNALARHIPAGYGLKSMSQIDSGDSASLLSVPKLLDLDMLKIKWVDGYPNNEVWLNDNTRVVHGNRSSAIPGATSKAMLDGATCSTIFAHIHKIEMAYRAVYGRTVSQIFAGSPGCLISLDPLLVPGGTSQQNLQQGIGIVSHSDDTCSFQVAPILNGSTMIDGNQISVSSITGVKRLAKFGWGLPESLAD